MRTPKSLVMAGAWLAIATAACGGTAAPSATAEPTASAASEAFVADIDVGGHALHIVCVGPTDTGRPTVIFEHGLGGDYRVWGDVMGGIKATDRGCSYDRAGVGMSEPAETPRTTADQVEDLHALLEAAGIEPPYVLVGFSIGGWNAMVFTDRYPDEVAGVVLADVRPPGLSAGLLDQLPAEAEGESDAIRMNREELTVFEADPSLNAEGLDLRASADEAGAVDLGDRPLEVLWVADTAGFWEGLDADLAARMDAVLMETRGDVEALSSDSHASLVDAPHEIPAEQPGAVVDAIQAVLDRVPG